MAYTFPMGCAASPEGRSEKAQFTSLPVALRSGERFARESAALWKLLRPGVASLARYLLGLFERETKRKSHHKWGCGVPPPLRDKSTFHELVKICGPRNEAWTICVTWIVWVKFRARPHDFRPKIIGHVDQIS